ncbi:NADH-ubiquinone oxidoreductase B12 [Cordyceps militaris]|uniref:NADH-ubiquinone oxidoreductase B12 n=1 Tax=Cordyceps militaris TaxID=73501 RepID=A0A2H4SVY7_CORMI|nr:NADH-ubiquinone oxidoreductase B12 [Cordyceps militaris]
MLPTRCDSDTTTSNWRVQDSPPLLPEHHIVPVLRAAQGGKANITGFSMRAFKEAAGSARYDPWERADAWRTQGPFTRWNRFRNTLPGLGTATVLFAGYCTYEHFFMQDEHHHGEEAAHH